VGPDPRAREARASRVIERNDMSESTLRRFVSSHPPRRILVGLLCAVALLALPNPATAASTPEPVWEAQAGACSFSWQDSTSGSDVAYGIVESPAESDVSCELVISDASRSDLATVTVVGGPGVIYFAASGDYTYLLIDQNVNADAGGVVTLSGTPSLLRPSSGSATVAGCTRSLEKRSIPGHLATYTAGWNIVTAASLSTCSSDVIGSPTAYLGSASRVRTQVALLDPFGISLTKSATRNGTEITSVNVGDQIVYQFTVTNTGLVPWTVTVTDPLPGLGPMSCPVGALLPGAAMTCTAPYVVTDADRTAGLLVNTATATGLDSIRANATGASTPSEPAFASLTVSGTDQPTTPDPTNAPGSPYSNSSAPTTPPQTSELAATGGSSPAPVALLGMGLSAAGLGAVGAARRRGPARTRGNPSTGGGSRHPA